MNSHVPSTRCKSGATEQTAVQSNSMLANSLIILTLSRLTIPQLLKRVVFFPILVSVFNISQAIKKPMPISINNSLPSVTLHLGLLEDEENTMRMLVDTGTAMNSGNLAYHLWVMSECPEMVGESIQCGGTSDYDVVKLLAALDLDTSQQSVEHGHMAAVIRYRTPYLVNKRDPLFIYFSLENDVSLRCVLGLPTLLTIGGLINLVKGEFFCSDIDRTFALSLEPPGKGLPDGVASDNSTPTIPEGVPTNIKPNPSLLHFTSTEGHVVTNPFPHYSSNIIVRDSFYKGNFSRELEYNPL